MSILPITFKNDHFFIFLKKIWNNPIKISTIAILVFLPSMILTPLVFYIFSVLLFFTGMLSSMDRKNLKEFTTNALLYIFTSLIIFFRYFPEAQDWIIGTFLYALFVFGLVVIFILIAVYATSILNSYAPESARWKNKKMNIFEYFISYLVLFAVGSIRMYMFVGVATVVFLPIIFYCFDDSLVCELLNPVGRYLESVVNTEYLNKSFVLITFVGASINYIFYCLRMKYES